MKKTYRNDIEEADDDGQDAGSNKQTPEGETQRLLARCLLVHVAEQIEAQDHHGTAQRNEAMGSAEQRPVPCEVATEEGAFGDNEEHCAC